MARGFRQLNQRQYPRRQWSLCGYPDSGKSTFAARMAGDEGVVAIDADQRFDMVAGLAGGVVYTSDDPKENVLLTAIVQNLHEAMPADMPDVRLIVVDSLTTIIAPLVSGAILGNLSGSNKNRSAAFVEKAVAMRLLQDAVTRWGTDTLWIYHLQEGRDQNGKPHVTTSIPATELARLQRSLNASLRVVLDKAGKRGIFVEWSRAGRAGMTLWDDSGSWVDMPAKLEAAMYDGLRADEVQPTTFSGPQQAMQWAVTRGAYSDVTAARAAYDEIKAAHAPQNASEMWALWTVHVARFLGSMGATNEAGMPANSF